MSDPVGQSSGLLATARNFAQNLLGSVQNRLELFGAELQEEKFRLIQIIIWIAATAFSGMMALTFASITVVYLFWESARIAVLCGLALFYTVGFAIIMWQFHRFLGRQPKPFAATIAEFEKDRACIRPTN